MVFPHLTSPRGEGSGSRGGNCKVGKLMSARLTAEQLERLRRAQPESINPTATASDSSFMRILASLEREVLDHLMVEQFYDPGEIVIHEGSPGDAMYLIWSGRLAVLKGDFDAPDVLLYREPGEVIGEMALLEDKARSASVVAIDESRLLRIGRTAFQELLRQKPEISINIMSYLSARLRAAHDLSSVNVQVGRELSYQVSELELENRHLQELQQVRQETSDLIIHDLRAPLGSLHGAIQMLAVTLSAEAVEANRELLNIVDVSYSRD